MDKERDPMIVSSDIERSLTPEEDTLLEGKLHATFETMTASEELKARTLKAMQEASEQATHVVPARDIKPMQKQTTSPQSFRKTFSVYRRRFIAVIAAACLAFASLGGGVAYATETAYVSIEATPSVELALNCFDIVVKTTASNAAGNDLINQVNVQNKPYDEAVRMLIQAAQGEGMISDSDVVSVTVASNNNGQVNSLVNKAQSTLTSLNCNASYSETNMETREQAQENGLSTGRYRAYLELQSLGSSLSLQDCMNMSMPQLKAAIEALGGSSNAAENGNNSSQGGGQSGGQGSGSGTGSMSGQGSSAMDTGSSSSGQGGEANRQQGKS